jgi:hypothetical protein
MSRFHATLAIPAGPPPEVLAEIDEAWERAQAAVPGDFELHFESEPRLARAWGSILTADGELVERIPARTAVAIACGDADPWPPHAVIV